MASRVGQELRWAVCQRSGKWGWKTLFAHGPQENAENMRKIKHPEEKLELFSWLKDKGTPLFFNKEVWRELPSAF